MISRKNKSVFVITIILSVLVFLATTYSFVAPAQSRTTQDALSCQLDEHIHTAECFATYADDYGDKIIVCGIMAENGDISHIHDSFCYDGMNDLICPLEEFVHTHEQSCFNENNEQICGITVHQHSEQCFSDTVNREDYQRLVCSHEAHSHRDSCYELHTQEEIVPSEDVQPEGIQNEIYDIQPLNAEFEVQEEVYSAENTAAMYTLDTSGAINLSQTENGSYKYIDNIKVSYQKSDKWIHIDNGNNNKLPADADYRLEVSYKNISMADLNNSSCGGKLTLSGIPDWLNPDQNGNIMYDSVPVGTMKVENGTLLITFNSDFLTDPAHAGKTLDGTFIVRGSVDWHKLGNNHTGDIHLPTIDMSIDFEDNLLPKYGQLSFSKSNPEYIHGSDGNYYLKYVLTVKSLESNVAIPNVRVEDSFTRNGGYIAEYCGISGTSTTLGTSPNGYNPFETRTGNAGTVVKNADSMEWNIGELQANEERRLTYYAKINPSYIGSFSKGSIENSAEAFSSNISKGKASSVFIPTATASINKTLDENRTHVDDYGTGTLTYSVIIKADEHNSYDLENLILHDYVDSSFGGFLEQYPVSVTAVSDKTTGTQNCSFTKPDATSFNAAIPTLKPGETITVTYTVKVKNILLYGPGTIDFLNTAELLPGDSSNHVIPGYAFHTSQNTHTFTQSQWMRKINGENLKADTEVTINPNDKAFEYNGESIIAATSPHEKFTVPKGDKEYQVILNEEGRWDLSSTNMKDYFDDGSGIIYKGWLCIQEFNINHEIESDTEITDAQALENITGLTPVNTVWLNIDGRKEFSFIPANIGLEHDSKSTYLLTYYAGIENVADAGTVSITNNFKVYGTIGVGTGTYNINGIKVSVSSIVQGNIHYNVHKDSWYYSQHPNEEDGVEIHNANDYKHGAIYWVIRADGNINKGFRIKDVPHNHGTEDQLVRDDSVAGIYKGSKDLDFTKTFNSYSEMLESVDGGTLVELNGNDTNLGYDPGVLYKQFNVDNISDLNTRSFVIANFNPNPYADIGALTNQSKTENYQGLIGNKDITCQNNDKNPPITSADELTQWTFEKVQDNATNTFYVYSNVGNERKYISISGENGGGNVTLSDEPVKLYIRQNEKDYSGKIRITNEHGMALNWYGQNGVSEIFSGYNAGGDHDVNDFHTLLEPNKVANNYDYTWFAKNQNDNIEVCFQKNMNLTDDEALYIVVRTALKTEHGEKTHDTKFTNGVETKQNSTSSSNWVPVHNAEYILKTATPVYKEGKEAYRFDGTNWTAPANNRLQYWHTNLITEPGTYAEWLININWDGSMSGMAEVSDKLPDYLTPVYLCPFWVPITNTTYPDIPTLKSDPNWIEMKTNSSMEESYTPLTYYYNSSTNEVRFNIENLEKESNPEDFNTQTVNIQLICKVNDPEILLSGGTESIDNTVTVTNRGQVHKNTGTVNISPNCSLDKKFTDYQYNEPKYDRTTDRRLHFKITVNPYKETLGKDGHLPPLIDEFENLIIIESSLQVKKEDGTIISEYTYDIEDNKMIFNKLPDNQKLIITYAARLKKAPTEQEDVSVSNRAYWENHTPPQNWQVNNLQVVYDMSGNVNLSGKLTNPTVSILKVDSEDRTVGLNGADFELYKYNSNPNLADELIARGTTGDDGKLVFKNNDAEIRIEYDKVYYIKETKAPNGYQLSTENHYFVVLQNKASDDSSFKDIPDLDTFDALSFETDPNSSDGKYICAYECIIENDKEKIWVEKSFTDENIDGENKEFTPQSGKYRFGIFDKNPVEHHDAKPLQILEIEYKSGNPEYPKYTLDNEPKIYPEFTIAKPNETYFVFELDESNKPIFNDNYLSANGHTYKVNYTSNLQNNKVTISSDSKVIKIENKVTYFELPNAGGMGLKKYYLFAGLLSVTAILIALIIKRKSLSDTRNSR